MRKDTEVVYAGQDHTGQPVELLVWLTQVEIPVDLGGLLGESAWISGAFLCVTVVVEGIVSGGYTAVLQLSPTSICVRRGCVHPHLMCVLVLESPPFSQ